MSNCLTTKDTLALTFSSRFDLLVTLRVSILSTGDYEVSIRFNDEHVPDSPFIVPVASPSDDARRLTVASLQVRL